VALRPVAAAIAVLALALTWSGGGRAQSGSMEYAVKAAYLFKFAPFVDWPTGAFASATSPFVVCVAGTDPFGSALDKAVNGQRVGDHPVTVRRLARVDSARGCHILFVGATRGQTPAEALRTVRGAPVLTVADQGAGAQGAIIRFVVRDNRVRFEIDTEAAASNGVNISSKLLSLALNAGGKG
jgi:hypothetical protein